MALLRTYRGRPDDVPDIQALLVCPRRLLAVGFSVRTAFFALLAWTSQVLPVGADEEKT